MIPMTRPQLLQRIEQTFGARLVKQPGAMAALLEDICWQVYQWAHEDAPAYRGYARLGLGQYVLNHSCAGDPAEFVASIATEAEKEGRTVGDSRDNVPGAQLLPEAMAVRIRFENVAGLNAMEHQLRLLRAVHFPDSTQAEAMPGKVTEGEAQPQPDMYWDADNPEEVQGDGAADFAENYASNALCPGDTSIVKVLCATRAHTRRMRISVDADREKEDWLKWEWLDSAPQLAAPVALTLAAASVLAERRRQVEQEGWTPESDAQYMGGDMASAAGCYALFGPPMNPVGNPPPYWPWAAEWWKPTTSYRRNLVKAGALVLAEIERLDRAEIASHTPQGEKP